MVCWHLPLCLHFTGSTFTKTCVPGVRFLLLQPLRVQAAWRPRPEGVYLPVKGTRVPRAKILDITETLWARVWCKDYNLLKAEGM